MKMKLDIMPVGVKFLDNETFQSVKDARFEDAKVISFCDGVRRLREEEIKGGLLITPNSIQTCKWAPVVLGFKRKENFFEQSIEPHLKYPTKGVFIFNMDEDKNNIPRFEKNNPNKMPDSVIVRTTPNKIATIIKLVGKENFALDYADKLERSALSLFLKNPNSLKVNLTRIVNKTLTQLNLVPGWRKLTVLLFKSQSITLLFDMIIKSMLADMSMCRNSSVIPYKTQKGNVSFFCTGGVAWGNNSQENMTMGFPIDLYRKVAKYLLYPSRQGKSAQNKKRTYSEPQCA
jgi:uncharacterized protein (DUF169 family)